MTQELKALLNQKKGSFTAEERGAEEGAEKTEEEGKDSHRKKVEGQLQV